MKIKTDNNIYFEGVHFFKNIITDSNKEIFYKISELNPFKIFVKGLSESFEIENLDLCLESILLLISKNNEFYNTIENLKKDFYLCLIKKKIDDLRNHKNSLLYTRCCICVKNSINIYVFLN